MQDKTASDKQSRRLHRMLDSNPLKQELPTGRRHSARRRLLQRSEMVEVSSPDELVDAVSSGALDIVITNHLNLTGLELQYVLLSPAHCFRTFS